MRGNEYFKAIYPPKSGAGERARSAIAGLTAHALFDAPAGESEKNAHFHGSPYNLGYAALGPMLTGFMLWLGRQAKRDGISRLFFLSREGWILKQVYDALHVSDSCAVPTFYLYASRRATRVASLQTKGDVLALAGQPFRSGISVGELLNSRFGLVPTDIGVEVWSECGYTGPEDKLESMPSGRIKFSNLCVRSYDKILESATAERSVYLEYLHCSGIAEEKMPAVVDIGWRANMQGALGNLLGRALNGYYYATLQGAEVWKAKGHRIWAYAGDMIAANHPSAVVGNRHFLEYLTSHIEPSLVRLERNDAEIIPVYRMDENLGQRRLLIEEVHHGATQFARDFHAEFDHLVDQIWIDSFLGERVFASFAESPSKSDAAMFIGHYFEDALGGVKKQFIIKPNSKGAHADSVWKAGAQAVFKNVQTQITSDKKPAIRKIQAEVIDVDEESPRRWLEASIIRALSTERKFAKYERDRDGFFLDSKNPFATAWYKWR
jgi:hypothetical protein